MSNRDYIETLLRDVGDRTPKFKLGQRVIERYGSLGVIDVVYANFASAVNALAVPSGWYEMQTRPPKTPKSGFWYSVVLDEAGAVLAGEDDLEVQA